MARWIAVVALAGCGGGAPLPSAFEWLPGCYERGGIDWFHRDRWVVRGNELRGRSSAFGSMGPRWDAELVIRDEGRGAVLIVENGAWSFPTGSHAITRITDEEIRFTTPSGEQVVRRTWDGLLIGPAHDPDSELFRDPQCSLRLGMESANGVEPEAR